MSDTPLSAKELDPRVAQRLRRKLVWSRRAPRWVEDLGEDDWGLPEMEHALLIQKWMKEHQPERLDELHPPGSPRRLVD